MPTPMGAKEKYASIFESFKAIFSKEPLAEEAAIEHIENNSSKKKD